MMRSFNDLFNNAGWQQKAIAGGLGKTSSFVSTHLSLLKMGEGITALYQANITRDTETLNNLRQLSDLDPQIGERVCQAALKAGVTRQQSRELLNEAKRGVGSTQSGAQHPTSPSEIKDDQEQVALSVTPTSSSGPLEPLVKRAPVIEPESVEAVVVDAASALLAEIAPVEAVVVDAASALLAEIAPVEVDAPETRGVELSSAEATATEPLSIETRWRVVPAAALRIIVNILSDADFQQGVLMIDRVDHQSDHLWAKIWQGGQEKLVRVPVADIELVRLEALADD